mmetsp:Transcript_62370/g.142805  ORF Transcript_62370/g.142805 Transcript_62370/m.142805 type:complete len:203 (+) Transcript_62370:204-812(+)
MFRWSGRSRTAQGGQGGRSRSACCSPKSPSSSATSRRIWKRNYARPVRATAGGGRSRPHHRRSACLIPRRGLMSCTAPRSTRSRKIGGRRLISYRSISCRSAPKKRPSNARPTPTLRGSRIWRRIAATSARRCRYSWPRRTTTTRSSQLSRTRCSRWHGAPRTNSARSASPRRGPRRSCKRSRQRSEQRRLRWIGSRRSSCP